MAQPQPNMQRLANSLHDAGKEFALLNNLPGLQNNDQLQIITAQLQVIMNRLENIENNQQVMRNQLQNLNNAYGFLSAVASYSDRNDLQNDTHPYALD